MIVEGWEGVCWVWDVCYSVGVRVVIGATKAISCETSCIMVFG